MPPRGRSALERPALPLLDMLSVRSRSDCVSSDTALGGAGGRRRCAERPPGVMEPDVEKALPMGVVSSSADAS